MLTTPLCNLSEVALVAIGNIVSKEIDDIATVQMGDDPHIAAINESLRADFRAIEAALKEYHGVEEVSDVLCIPKYW